MVSGGSLAVGDGLGKVNLLRVDGVEITAWELWTESVADGSEPETEVRAGPPAVPPARTLQTLAERLRDATRRQREPSRSMEEDEGDE